MHIEGYRTFYKTKSKEAHKAERTLYYNGDPHLTPNEFKKHQNLLTRIAATQKRQNNTASNRGYKPVKIAPLKPTIKRSQNKYNKNLYLTNEERAARAQEQLIANQSRRQKNQINANRRYRTGGSKKKTTNNIKRVKAINGRIMYFKNGKQISKKKALK